MATEVSTLLKLLVRILVDAASSDSELQAELQRLIRLAAPLPEPGAVERPAGASVGQGPADVDGLPRALPRGDGAPETASQAPAAPVADLLPAHSQTAPPSDLIDIETAVSRITLGRRSADAAASPQVAAVNTPAISDSHRRGDDLQLTAERCRIKAEAARWCAERRRLITRNADFQVDVAPRDRDIFARAKRLDDCFLWMCNPQTAPSPKDIREFETLAGCYDAVADAIELICAIEQSSDRQSAEFERALDLLAEAQSALRCIVIAIGGTKDAEQERVFQWLKSVTSTQQIFIQRHMRIDDPARPENWSELRDRIAEVDARVEDNRQRRKHRQKLLNKVRHKASLIAQEPDPGRHDWEPIVSAVEQLLQDGLPPSNIDLRDALLVAADWFPPVTGVPAGFARVVSEVDRYLADNVPLESENCETPIPEVQAACRLLAGRSLMIIGGVRRPASARAIEQALQLREVIWPATREHQSIDSFEADIARDDVAVVVLAIRWSSHAFGEVRAFCERYGKPLVRLPAGYSPNQIATHIMQQCSDRLSESAHGSPT